MNLNQETDTESAPDVKPRKACRNCYGRGFSGYDKDNKKVICGCVVRRFYKANARKLVEDEKGMEMKPAQLTSAGGW